MVNGKCQRMHGGRSSFFAKMNTSKTGQKNAWIKDTLHEHTRQHLDQPKVENWKVASRDWELYNEYVTKKNVEVGSNDRCEPSLPSTSKLASNCASSPRNRTTIVISIAAGTSYTITWWEVAWSGRKTCQGCTRPHFPNCSLLRFMKRSHNKRLCLIDIPGRHLISPWYPDNILFCMLCTCRLLSLPNGMCTAKIPTRDLETTKTSKQMTPLLCKPFPNSKPSHCGLEIHAYLST